jgi:hypothetical protein
MVETDTNNHGNPRQFWPWLFAEPIVEAFLEHALMMEELEKEGVAAIEYEARKEAGTLLKRTYDNQPAVIPDISE